MTLSAILYQYISIHIPLPNGSPWKLLKTVHCGPGLVVPSAKQPDLISVNVSLEEGADQEMEWDKSLGTSSQVSSSQSRKCWTLMKRILWENIYYITETLYHSVEFWSFLTRISLVFHWLENIYVRLNKCVASEWKYHFIDNFSTIDKRSTSS